MSAPTRVELSRTLRAAAQSRDPELAAYAAAGLRRLKNLQRARRMAARVAGLVRS